MEHTSLTHLCLAYNQTDFFVSVHTHSPFFINKGNNFLYIYTYIHMYIYTHTHMYKFIICIKCGGSPVSNFRALSSNGFQFPVQIGNLDLID